MLNSLVHFKKSGEGKRLCDSQEAGGVIKAYNLLYSYITLKRFDDLRVRDLK